MEADRQALGERLLIKLQVRVAHQASGERLLIRLQVRGCSSGFRLEAAHKASG